MNNRTLSCKTEHRNITTFWTFSGSQRTCEEEKKKKKGARRKFVLFPTIMAGTEMRSLIGVKAGSGSQSLMENKTSHLESFNEPATFSKYLFSSLVTGCPNNDT